MLTLSVLLSIECSFRPSPIRSLGLRRWLKGMATAFLEATLRSWTTAALKAPPRVVEMAAISRLERQEAILRLDDVTYMYEDRNVVGAPALPPVVGYIHGLLLLLLCAVIRLATRQYADGRRRVLGRRSDRCYLDIGKGCARRPDAAGARESRRARALAGEMLFDR